MEVATFEYEEVMRLEGLRITGRLRMLISERLLNEDDEAANLMVVPRDF